MPTQSAFLGNCVDRKVVIQELIKNALAACLFDTSNKVYTIAYTCAGMIQVACYSCYTDSYGTIRQDNLANQIFVAAKNIHRTEDTHDIRWWPGVAAISQYLYDETAGKVYL